MASPVSSRVASARGSRVVAMARLWVALIFRLWMRLGPVALAGFFLALAGALGAR